MPTPSPAPMGARLSRRAALAGIAGVAGAALVGCTADRDQPRKAAGPATVVPTVDPDVVVAAEALASQREVLDLLVATRKRHRRLSGELADVVAAHEAHAALLADAVPPDVSTSPSPTPGGRARRRTSVPRKPARAIERVVEAEQRLVTVTKRQAFRAQSGAFARLLGSMAAAAAQHAAVLAPGSVVGGSSS